MDQRPKGKRLRSHPKQGAHASWLSTDRPIQSAKQDLLGRSAFSSGLASNILSWNARESLVIALHGAWGSGKTSIKNLVLENLDSTRAGRKLQILEFCPWQLSGSSSLVAGFFQELGVVLGRNGSDAESERRAKALESYAKRLTLLGRTTVALGGLATFWSPEAGAMLVSAGASFDSAGKATGSGADAAKAAELAEAKTLTEIKQELTESMVSLESPILVVIDDIDRLTTQEILQLLQLVKVNADLPKLVYLLLFERKVVEQALDQVSGGRGREYLQKIVQAEFHVPQAHRQAIATVLFDGLNRLLDHDRIKKRFDEDRWRSLYVDHVERFFDNLRHVYRFLGSFSFHVSQFKRGDSFEVNPVDLIGLEALRVFQPGLYEQLPNMKPILARNTSQVLYGRISQQDLDAAVEQLLSDSSPADHPALKAILKNLFPPLSQPLDRNNRSDPGLEAWLRDQRVCHGDHFDKYFALALRRDDLSQADLDRLIEATNDRLGFVAKCRDLMDRSLLEVAFERLGASIETVPLSHMPVLIRALADLSDSFQEPDVRPFFFPRDLMAHAWRLVYFGLRREPDMTKRLTVLKEAFTDTPSLALPVKIVSLDERINDREASGHAFLVEEAHLNQLKTICVEKIRAASESPQFLSNRHRLAYLLNWSRWGSNEEVRGWIERNTQSPDGAVWFLRTFLSQSSASGVDGTTLYYYIQLRLIERFCDVTRLNELTSTISDESLTGLDRTARIQFRKALLRQANGRSDDDWQQDAEPRRL